MISVSRGVSLHVVQPRPRRAMRTHLGVQIALDRVPAAPVSALGAAVACAVAPADHDQIAYSAASTTSAWSTASGGRVRGPEASRHGTRAAIRNDVAAHKLKGFGSKTLRARLGLKVTGSRYVRHRRSERSDRGQRGVLLRSSCTEEALDHRHHNQRIPSRVIPEQGSLGPTQQLHRSGGLT